MRRRLRAHEVAVLAFAGAIVGGSARVALAHDFWLVPEFFLFPEGWSVHVYGNTGERFPESQSALAARRVDRVEVVSPNGRRAVTGFRHVGKSLVFEVADLSRGEHWIAVAVRPNPIDLTAEEFNDYLTHDGLPQILEERKRSGELDLDVREFYTKFAKTLVQVGEGGPRVFDTPVGHLIEIVPRQDPAAVEPGDSLSVAVLYEGRELPGVTVSAGYADRPGEGHAHSRVTDAKGRVTIPISSPGRWYLRTIHMVRGRQAGVDWESFWATFTFEVRPPHASP